MSREERPEGEGNRKVVLVVRLAVEGGKKGGNEEKKNIRDLV